MSRREREKEKRRHEFDRMVCSARQLSLRCDGVFDDSSQRAARHYGRLPNVIR